MQIPARWRFVILLHIGFVIQMILLTNLNITIVAMVNCTSTAGSSGDMLTNSSNANEEGDARGRFAWTQQEQGYVLGASFYGFLVTAVPSGYLAQMLGGKWLFGGGVFIGSLLTLLTPAAASWSIHALLVVRIGIGLGLGFILPPAQEMVARWAREKERTRMTTLIKSGVQMGSVIGYPVSGALAYSDLLGGWPSVFYMGGAAGVVYSLVWAAFGRGRPNSETLYAEAEEGKETNPMPIEAGRDGDSLADDTHSATPSDVTAPADVTTSADVRGDEAKKVVPWKHILFNRYTFAIFFAHFAFGWSYALVLTGLPTYYKETLGFDIRSNGLISALPYIAAIASTNMAGIIADKVRRKRLTTGATRKIICAFAFLAHGLCLIGAIHTPAESNQLVIALMTLATFALCCNHAGSLNNSIDIAPRFNGVIYGVSQTFGMSGSVFAPMATGYFLNKNASREQYAKVFYLSAGVSALGALVFCVLSTGEQQPWNDCMEESDCGIENNCAGGGQGAADVQEEDGKIELQMERLLERDTLEKA